jgi:eukaryotic-like serine/threonine-protein kinase
VAENTGREGRIVGGRFELVKKLGEGGMGAVYRARDRDTDTVVAVKLTVGAANARRFDREAALLSRIEHPAVVRYLAHGRTGLGERFLVMEWVEGEPLASLFAIRELGIGETLALARRMASALEAVHAHGLLHRDIKPGNVIVPSAGVAGAKLIDFGIAVDAHALTRLTAPGCVVGTWAYMAPERARTELPVDERSDLYSLGCVLFQALTGSRAAPGDDAAELMSHILLVPPPRASALRRDVPPALDALLVELLAKSPAERPTSAREVRERLEAIGAPAGDRPPAARTAPSELNALIGSMLPAPGSPPSLEAGDTSTMDDSSTDQMSLPPSTLRR